MCHCATGVKWFLTFRKTAGFIVSQAVFDPDDEGVRNLQNVSNPSINDTASHSRRHAPSW
jgi:hypothetical protein